MTNKSVVRLHHTIVPSCI